jgi:hypothetical protein
MLDFGELWEMVLNSVVSGIPNETMPRRWMSAIASLPRPATCTLARHLPPLVSTKRARGAYTFAPTRRDPVPSVHLPGPGE